MYSNMLERFTCRMKCIDISLHISGIVRPYVIEERGVRKTKVFLQRSGVDFNPVNQLLYI